MELFKYPTALLYLILIVFLYEITHFPRNKNVYKSRKHSVKHICIACYATVTFLQCYTTYFNQMKNFYPHAF